MAEAPNAFNDVVLRFLAEVDQAADVEEWTAQLVAAAQHRDPAGLLDHEEQLGKPGSACDVGRVVEVADALQRQPGRPLGSMLLRGAAGWQGNQRQGRQQDDRDGLLPHAITLPAIAYFFSTTSPLSLTSVLRSAELIFTVKVPPGAAPPPVFALVVSLRPASTA